MNLFEKYKAALIDMDGVLYDSMPAHALAWQRMMRETGVECSRDEFFLYEGMTGIATVNLLFNRAFGHGCSDEEALRLYEIKSKYFKDSGPARMMPGAGKMLTALKRGGLKRVLVTGSGQRSLLDALDRDYPGIFKPSMRITAHDVKNGKPDPEPYLKGASRAGVCPGECIVVENAPLGVRSGKAAGCFTIAVTTGPVPRSEFEKEGADMIFSSMDEFADFLESQLADAEGLRTQLRAVIDELEPDKVFFLTDSNVRKLVMADRMENNNTYVMPAGENSKSFETIENIIEWLMRREATRRSLLVNVGGGVVTDIGGFAASIFKRGIRFVNVPTSLLGAADAAIGGKNGIDFRNVKNVAGTFAMPSAVIIDPELMATLPRKEILSGFAEIVKMALISDAALYEELIEGDALSDPELMNKALRHAADCKKEIVALDPEEQGLRRILNFGHTFGHALEALAGMKGNPVSHGEAVAQGMLAALRLSEKYAGLSPAVAKNYKERILDRYYKPFPIAEEDCETLRQLMQNDKKNHGTGCISFVLLSSPGNPIESYEILPDDIPLELMR